MANVLTAGNSSNGGTAISTDTSGTLNIVTGSGSGANAITIDASQNVTFANAISTTGNGTIGGALAVTGNTTITGTLTATGGVSGGIRSGTAVASTSGTSIDFTSIPSGVKRITVMFNGVSTNGTSNLQVQIGDGSINTSGYTTATTVSGTGSAQTVTTTNPTTGFVFAASLGAASNLQNGLMTIVNLGSNIWCFSSTVSRSDTAFTTWASGSKTLSGTLDRLRITTVNGTDTFDAGSINILYE